MTINGLDYASWRPPSPSWLSANGYHFVCRYLGSSWKRIFIAEYAGLRAAGVAVVLNFEGLATGMKGGFFAGVRDATVALSQARSLGVQHPVVYFSADWDVSSSDQAAVNAYLRGAGSVLGGPQFVGVYGGYNCVVRAAAAGVCHWFWQTYAWSGGRWFAGAHIRQIHNTTSYDHNTATTANFGQVGGSVPSPSPTLPVTSEEEDMNVDLRVGEPHTFVNPAHYRGGGSKTVYSVGTDFGDAVVRFASFSAKTNSWDKVITVNPTRAGWPTVALVADADTLKVSVQRLPLDGQDPSKDIGIPCGLVVVTV